MRNNKKGITFTSITVYLILFFMFTTITIIISSGFNEELFNDRGTAINVTAINKLEYNLLKSAEESYELEFKMEDKKSKITFSNSDEYVFDKDKHVIYKNGGKLVNFLGDYTITPMDGFFIINVTLNKYTNEVSRKIVVGTKINTYIQDGLIGRFDGINNAGINKHSDNATVWKNLAKNAPDATLSNNFTYDGVTNGWTEKGLLLKKDSTTGKIPDAKATYSDVSYPTATIEVTMTSVDQIGAENNSYVYPVRFFAANSSTLNLQIGIRYNVALMYGLGNNTVFNKPTNIAIENGETYTLTFVQNDLTTRSLYINGEYIMNKTNLSLSELQFSVLSITNISTTNRYIVNSVRLYNRALTDDEINENYYIDKLRFGE